MTTATDPFVADPAARAAHEARRRLWFSRITRIEGWLSVFGLGFLVPILKMIGGDDVRTQSRELWRLAGVPIVAVALFLGAWSVLAPRVQTSLGAIPGPAAVWEQVGVLLADHAAERARERAFYERQDKRITDARAASPPVEIRPKTYVGKPTYVDKILTSLKTVFTGFLIGTAVAIPLGILAGLSPIVNAAINPFVQIFKPVSPLAWLPLVTMVVSALYTSTDPMFEKSFLVSAITVTLCSLWPTLINTSLGVASIDRDLMNVARVLRLGWGKKVLKLVIPSSLPLIFTGMRLSLGVGWMVLIAAEMLAQNPGLGKFVWDEFQNGSSASLARIMVAVFTIGIIGFLLDRVMYALQAAFTFSAKR
jgi:nitrate/nitrite transport system permease protein